LRGASLEEIAKAAGVSRPALYHHFSNKEELFKEMARSVCENVLGKIAEAGDGEGPIHDRLQRMFYAKATELHDMLWKARHGMEIFDASHHLCADVNRKFHDEFERLVADVLQDGAKRGEVDIAPLAITYRAAASFLVHCAEGLHARHTGTAVDPGVYRKRLSLLVDCFLARAGK
jgi:AcrR family transcriptional regulator